MSLSIGHNRRGGSNGQNGEDGSSPKQEQDEGVSSTVKRASNRSHGKANKIAQGPLQASNNTMEAGPLNVRMFQSEEYQILATERQQVVSGREFLAEARPLRGMPGMV